MTIFPPLKQKRNEKKWFYCWNNFVIQFYSINGTEQRTKNCKISLVNSNLADLSCLYKEFYVILRK